MLLFLIGIVGFYFICKVDSNNFLATDHSAGLNIGIHSTIKNVSIREGSGGGAGGAAAPPIFWDGLP